MHSMGADIEQLENGGKEGEDREACGIQSGVQ